MISAVAYKRTVLIFQLLIPLVIVSLALGGCQWRKPVIKTVRNVEISGYNPIKGEFTLDYTPVVYNPNSFEIWCDRLEMDIHLDEIHMGKAVSQENFSIPARGEEEFTLSQNVQVESIGRTMDILVRRDSLIIYLESKFHFTGENFQISIPYNHQSTIHPKRELGRIILGL